MKVIGDETGDDTERRWRWVGPEWSLIPAVFGLVALIVLAGFIRYGSVDPCYMLTQEAATRTGLPLSVATAILAKKDLTVGHCMGRLWEIYTGQVEP